MKQQRISIAVVVHSLDPSLFTQLIVRMIATMNQTHNELCYYEPTDAQ